MTNELKTVLHQLLTLSYTKPHGSHGTWSEEWNWEVFSVTHDDHTLIRCEYTSSNRNIKIPWFKTEKMDTAPVIKEKCLSMMKKTI